MSLEAALSLFAIMLALAAMPSASVALVVTRSATHGLANGIAVAVGVVLGDLVFVLLALLGMTLLAQTMGAMFGVIRYVAAAYLIWLGFSLWRSRSAAALGERGRGGSALMSSTLAGLLLTLGDLKAILFYASLFPSMFDLTALSTADTGLVVVLTVVTVGGVKVGYALAAKHVVRRFRRSAIGDYGRIAAGGALVGTGTYLIVET